MDLCKIIQFDWLVRNESPIPCHVLNIRVNVTLRDLQVELILNVNQKDVAYFKYPSSLPSPQPLTSFIVEKILLSWLDFSLLVPSSILHIQSNEYFSLRTIALQIESHRSILYFINESHGQILKVTDQILYSIIEKGH